MGSQAAIPMSTSADSVNPLLSTFLCDSAPGRALREALIAFAADRGLAADALTLGDALRLLQPTPCSVPGLRDAMRARGWTQTAAATELGFTQAQLSRWLRGQASPSVGSARKIAAKLGMSLIELLGDAEPAAPDTVDAPNSAAGDKSELSPRERAALDHQRVVANALQMQMTARPAIVATRAKPPDQAEVDRIVSAMQSLR